LYTSGSVPSLPQEAESTNGYCLPDALRDRRAVLAVAHPGHELRVYGWMELAHPTVCVLTDGSGHSGQSRLESTARLLDHSSARLGSIYGRFKDIEIYEAILDGNVGIFTELVEEISETFVLDDVEYVVGDAAEGYNPIHDLCRSVINAAVKLANIRKHCGIANFDFLVIGQPDLSSDRFRSGEVLLQLDEVALERKLEAAKSYAELRDDVGKMINEVGKSSFRFEALRPVVSAVDADGPVQEPPFYERYGERQVAEGYYRRVIRYREHILPLIDALQNYLQR